MLDFISHRANQVAIGTAVTIAVLALNTLWALLGAGETAFNIAGIVLGFASFGLAYVHEHFVDERPGLCRALFWASVGSAAAAALAWVLSL